MNTPIDYIVKQFTADAISEERKEVLMPLADYIQSKVAEKASIRLNFICTHNSRRSHLSQIWAQTMAYYFGIPQVFCYSGGTEATALFYKVADTLTEQGFEVQALSATNNPIYAVKYAANENAIICFSKVYNDSFNPKTGFAAVLTCNAADENCPVVFGAEKRIPVKYDDPKAFDGTDLMDAKYQERSLEIAQEMWFVFSRIKGN
jgi:arsenate reductase